MNIVQIKVDITLDLGLENKNHFRALLLTLVFQRVGMIRTRLSKIQIHYTGFLCEYLNLTQIFTGGVSRKYFSQNELGNKIFVMSGKSQVM